MNDDLLNILSDSNKEIDNQKLMDYLSDKLSQEDKHEFEKELIDSDLMNDAVEGLEKFNDKKDLQLFVEQLNSNLKKQIGKKKSQKAKHRIENMPWLYLTIIIIIVIILISFLVLWKHIDP